jgi:centrosomal protein CEP41
VNKSTIRIGVKDDGIGITKENQGKLFQEFGKIITKETKNMNSMGVGLGL